MIIDEVIEQLTHKGIKVGVKNKNFKIDELKYDGPIISNKLPGRFEKKNSRTKKKRLCRRYRAVCNGIS